MEFADISRTAIEIYAQIAAAAVPVAVVFAICDIIVTTFLRAALGGKIQFGGGVVK